MWGRARNRGLGQGVGVKGGQGGLKFFTSDCGRHIAVGRDGGVWGEAMMGVRRVVGKGVGRGFNRSFEQNRYRYIEFGYRHAHYGTKSDENRDYEGVFPFLAGNPRIMTS